MSCCHIERSDQKKGFMMAHKLLAPLRNVCYLLLICGWGDTLKFWLIHWSEWHTNLRIMFMLIPWDGSSNRHTRWKSTKISRGLICLLNSHVAPLEFGRSNSDSNFIHLTFHSDPKHVTIKRSLIGLNCDSTTMNCKTAIRGWTNAASDGYHTYYELGEDIIITIRRKVDSGKQSLLQLHLLPLQQVYMKESFYHYHHSKIFI